MNIDNNNSTQNVLLKDFLNQAFQSKNFFTNADTIALKLKEYIDNDTYFLKNEATLILNDKLEYSLGSNFYAGEKSHVTYIDILIKLYRPLFQSKKKPHDLVWGEKTLYLLDQTTQGRVLLLEQGVDLRKSTSYKAARKFAVEKICESIVKECDFFFYSRKIADYDEKINQYQQRIALYFDEKQHNWSELIAQYPSIQIAHLANHFGHELKPADIKLIFQHVMQHLYRNSSNKRDYQYNIEVLSDLIIGAKFFAHTLAPSKKINQAMAKFFNYSLKSEEDMQFLSHQDTFAMQLMNNPEFRLHNMEKRIECRKLLSTFGTLYVTDEQRESIKKPEVVKRKNKI